MIAGHTRANTSVASIRHYSDFRVPPAFSLIATEIPKQNGVRIAPRVVAIEDGDTAMVSVPAALGSDENGDRFISVGVNQ